jgi:hypothetical protein
MSETAGRLMETLIREADYQGFSFRDLTEEIGSKSATVHHHLRIRNGGSWRPSIWQEVL